MSEFLPANLSKFASFQSDNKTATFTEYEKFKSLVTRYDNRPKIYHGMTLFGGSPLDCYRYNASNPQLAMDHYLPGEQMNGGPVCTLKNPTKVYPWEKGDLFWAINFQVLNHMDPTWDLYVFLEFVPLPLYDSANIIGINWDGSQTINCPAHIALYVPRDTYKFADLVLRGTAKGLAWECSETPMTTWPAQEDKPKTYHFMDPRIRDIEL